MKGLYIFIAVFMIFISGCGWLRETRVNNTRSSSRLTEGSSTKSNYQLTDRKDVQFLQIQRDSLNVLSQVMIWPKGKFNLSAEKGFDGEAEMVYISKKKKASRELLNRGAVQQQTDRKSAATTKQNRELTSMEKEKTKYSLPVFRWWMLLIVFAFGWIVWRKIKI